MKVFIFHHAFKHYIVIEEDEIFAYHALAKRQSMSVDNCKKQYRLKKLKSYITKKALF